MSQNFPYAAVVIGALRVKAEDEQMTSRDGREMG